MYESPIELVYGNTQHIIEEDIFKTIQEMGVNVDKEELFKALKYDRGQYDKGYKDGKAERKKGKWIRNANGTYSCSLCQSWIPNEQWYYANYCLFCGADMREEKDNGK